MQRVIVHLDADAFFASVEQAADIRLRGRPIAVGGERRGIIASASYEARKFGVYTPMPTARARKLCPKLIVLPGDFERYEQFSRWMFNYCYDFTPDVEQTSIDEGYFDLSGTRKPALEIALTIRQAIRQSLKISVSEGIATNKLISQIASKLNKPAAFAEVPPGQEIAFLHPLPNRWLPGIGPKTAERLNAAGLAVIRQIAAIPVDGLELLLGSQARMVHQFARGMDDRPLIPIRDPAKSFSQQETFGQDLTDEEYVEAVLRRMADHLFAKVREEGKSIRTLTVKVRYNDMAEDQCSESLDEPTDLETDIYGRLRTMLRKAWKRRVSLRLVSLKLSHVYDGIFRVELPLDRSAERQEAQERLARVLDELRKARGKYVILRGHDLLLREAPQEAAARTGTSQRDVAATLAPPLSGASRRAAPGDGRAPKSGRGAAAAYVPLRVHSYYSFLDSTLSPEAIVALAKEQGCPAVALTDLGNLHGAVEFVQAAKKQGLRAILGAEVRVGRSPLLLYVQNATGYYNLSRLLSDLAAGEETKEEESVAARQRRALRWQEILRIGAQSDPGSSQVRSAGVPACELSRRPAGFFSERRDAAGTRSRDGCATRFMEGDKAERDHTAMCELFEGLIAVSHDPALAELFPGRFYELAAAQGVSEQYPTAACPSVHYGSPADRLKYDIVQSIRTRTLLRQEHPEKRLAGRYHFRKAAEMISGCKDHPDWLAHGREIAERCSFELPFGKPQFPAFRTPDGSASCDFLRRVVLDGLRRRYHGKRIVSETGANVPFAQVRAQVETELGIITEVGYEDLFLITWDLLQTCAERGIEWITRGSAADSLVCYCLGISDVCPIRFGLYFRRFLNKERMALHKLPDIDVDFAHDRKDDVVGLLFDKYGPEQCAVVGGFSTFQARSAVGDVAKVLGVSEFQIRRFTEHFPWSFGGGWVPVGHHRASGEELLELLRASPECRHLPLEEEPFKTAVEMGAFLDGFPRHPKMHPCGVVLSRQRMHELTPTFISNKGWPATHFDMDAVEAVGLVKMDILAQGGLAVMRDAKTTLAARGIEVDVGRLEPWQDDQVWDMIASGGARAVHHIESPAMTSLCRMTNVREIDGLIAVVSVIRPGAANEQKKVKFTRRYQGMEPPEYPHPSLEACLRSTFGLVVYEEHILQICEAFAGLSPGRADILRRALVKQDWATAKQIGREFAAAARARGHPMEKIAEVWELVTGFNGYAFCKAHSTAYGVEAYQGAWFKRYYPAEFMAAVLTNGKGFYDPLVYVLECHRIGLKFLPPSVNQPGPHFAVVTGAIRVPVTRVKGLTERTVERMLREREHSAFASQGDFYRRVAPRPEEMEAMIRAGAFDEFGEARTVQFWEAQHLYRAFGDAREPGQGWLLPPPSYNPVTASRQSAAENDNRDAQANPRDAGSSEVTLQEPTRLERLRSEADLFGFPVSGHPLELYENVAWDTYCPVARLNEHVGQEVVTCGLIVEQRTHHQVTGEPMKFLSLADWTGMVETELFAATYRTYGLATVRYPVLEIAAKVEPFENGRGFTLRVLRAGKPRTTLGNA